MWYVEDISSNELKIFTNDEIGFVCCNCIYWKVEDLHYHYRIRHPELRFSVIPPELQMLTRLEEIFLAPCIGVIQITASHVDEQLKSKGRTVNVSTDPGNSIYRYFAEKSR